MSTSELRRGPGWWMDLEGQWNPPEEWPEANPPLPGWTRGADGLWFDPGVGLDAELDTDTSQASTEPDAEAEKPATIDIHQPQMRRPVPEEHTVPSLDSLDTAAPPSAPAAESTNGTPPTFQVDRRQNEDRRSAPTPTQSALTFSEATANIPVALEENSRLKRQGVNAAFLAAVTASMLAGGLVLLLLLL